MNIAFDASAIVLARGGGMGNYTFRQFQHMIERAPEHRFFYFNLYEDASFPAAVHAPNFSSFSFSPGKGGFLLEQTEKGRSLLGALVRNFIREHKIDVFYITAPAHSFYEKEWFDGICVAVTCYDLIPLALSPSYLPTRKKMDDYLRNIRVFSFADISLAISESVRQDMVSLLGIPEERISVIHGGVGDIYRKQIVPRQAVKALREAHGIHGRFLLGNANSDLRKNAEGLIQAYALLPETLREEYQLVIAGVQEPVREEAILAFIDSLGLTERVVLTNYVSDQTLVRLYNLAELVIVPSLYEGFGLPIVEAWSCGKAVLASKTTSLGEVLGDAGLSFDPTDPADMARVMEEALTKADLPALAQRGAERLSLYQWDQVADRTLRALETACATSREAPDTVEKKPSLACIPLLSLEDLPGLDRLVAVLSSVYSVRVYTPEEAFASPVFLPEGFAPEAEDCDCVLYIAPTRLYAGAFALMQRKKGAWLVLDDAMSALLSGAPDAATPQAESPPSISPLSGHAADVVALLDACERAVTATRGEQELLLQSAAGKPVYALYGLYGEGADAGPDALERLPQVLRDVPLASFPAGALEQLLADHLHAFYYSDAEKRGLSRSVGYALRRELPAWKELGLE